MKTLSLYKKYSGFTLTEMLLAIAIIAIMSVVTIVGANTLAPYYRISGASKELMSKISQTQGYSVSQQVIHKITFDAGNNQYSIVKESTPEETIETVTLPRGVSITNLSANITDSTIKFNFVGAPLNSSNAPLGTSQITLGSSGGRTITIELSPAGNVKTN